jgi:hypothetical protein
MTTTTTFTVVPYLRSHGRSPRGRGVWAFQRARNASAFSYDLNGPVEFFSGSLAEAKKLARQAGMTGVVAILP